MRCAGSTALRPWGTAMVASHLYQTTAIATGEQGVPVPREKQINGCEDLRGCRRTSLGRDPPHDKMHVIRKAWARRMPARPTGSMGRRPGAPMSSPLGSGASPASWEAMFERHGAGRGPEAASSGLA